MNTILSIACPVLGTAAATCACYRRAWRLPATLALAALGLAILIRATETAAIHPLPSGISVEALRADFGRRVPEVRP